MCVCASVFVLVVRVWKRGSLMENVTSFQQKISEVWGFTAVSSGSPRVGAHTSHSWSANSQTAHQMRNLTLQLLHEVFFCTGCFNDYFRTNLELKCRRRKNTFVFREAFLKQLLLWVSLDFTDEDEIYEAIN